MPPETWISAEKKLDIARANGGLTKNQLPRLIVDLTNTALVINNRKKRIEVAEGLRRNFDERKSVSIRDNSEDEAMANITCVIYHLPNRVLRRIAKSQTEVVR